MMIRISDIAAHLLIAGSVCIRRGGRKDAIHNRDARVKMA
jgi:hypothetical protein